MLSIYRILTQLQRAYCVEIARIDREIAELQGTAAPTPVTSQNPAMRRRGSGGDWTAEEVATLRKHYGQQSYEDIALLLGRKPGSVKAKAQRLGLVASRRWSEAEIQIVQDAAKSGESIDATLSRLPGRTRLQLYHCRGRLRITVSKRGLLADLPEFIRERHAIDTSDSEICDEWNRTHPAEASVSRRWVSEVRRKLGLPDTRLSERQRQRVALKTREQLQAAGLPSLAALHRKAIQDRIEALGWPRDLRWREAQILTLIWERGPMTKRELCTALNVPFRGARNTLASNDPGGTYMASLIRRGLLISFRRAVGTGRQGGNVDLYSLSLDIQRRAVG